MICDLAETYHILNYRELSPQLVATLVLGLGDNSRVRRYFSKTKVTLEQILMAIMADNLQFIAWSKTKHKKNKPKSILKKLIDLDEQKEELESFETPEEFEEYMRNIKNGR